MQNNMSLSKLKFKTRWFPALMNLIGLGIAFSIFLILLSQVWWNFRYDRFEGSDQVYVVESPSFREGLYETSVVRPIVQMVADCSPDIAVVCDYVETRNNPADMIEIKDRDGEYVTARGINYAMTETAVIDVFNISLTVGRREDFFREGDALIAESTAIQYFPDRDPVGEVFKWLSPEGQKEGRIVGIYKNRKENETLVNGLLIHEGETDLALPNYDAHACYVRLAAGADVTYVREAVGKVQLNQSNKDLRLSQIHAARFEQDRDYWGRKDGGNKLMCILLTLIAVLFLSIAGFNYVNFAMASMPFHIKDINTRKVFGADRTMLVLRQVGRAFLLIDCAFLLGVLAMRTVSGTTWGTFLAWNLTPEKNVSVISIGALAAVLLAVVSGLIPALYSTSFQPALALKGTFATSMKGGGIRTATIALQYVLSFIFLTSALMLQRQTSYMTDNNELGFEHDRVLKMSSFAYMQVADVLERIREIPGVEDATRGDSPMQESVSSMSEIRNETSDEVVKYSWRYIPPEYADFFNLRLVDGRLPLPGEEKVALVNESFVDALPSFRVGQTLKRYDGEFTIIGILKDFHARSLENAYSPLVFFVGEGNYSSFMIRVAPAADVAVIMEKVKDIYHEMKPMIDKEQIETGFLDKDIEKLYEQEIRQTRLIRLSSILSLIITIIGILGVVWLDTRFTRKEIAIRKVNGATRREILSQICRKYLLIATVSFVIAVPIAVAICQRWLQHFAFRTNMPIRLFMLAFAIVIGITLAMVTLQAWMAASANPVESLKNE